MNADQFRSGAISLPGGDLDDLPSCCRECRLLLPKEFSVGEGLVYYFCGYAWQDEPTAFDLPCLESGGE
jgi:hypothetical protein